MRLTSQQLEQLRVRLHTKEDHEYYFLGYAFNLEKGIIQDQAFKDSRHMEFDAQILNVLFSHYLSGKPSPITSILMKFDKLQGGYAYENAFNTRVAEPIAKAFGMKPADLLEAGKMLGWQ